jgi:hypothetical protein
MTVSYPGIIRSLLSLLTDVPAADEIEVVTHHSRQPTLRQSSDENRIQERNVLVCVNKTLFQESIKILRERI